MDGKHSMDLRPDLKAVGANGTRSYADLTFNAPMRIEAFRIDDYSCNGTGAIEVRVRHAGMAALEFSFNEDTTYVYDPVPTPNESVSVAKACKAMNGKNLMLAEDLICPDEGITLDTEGAELNCLGKAIRGAKKGHGVILKAPKAKLRDCIIEGFDIGLMMENINSSLGSPVMEGLTINGNRIGILVNSTFEVIISGGEVRDNTEVGVLAVNATNLTLDNVLSRNNPYGFRIIDSRPVHMNVTALNSSIYGVEYIDQGHAYRMVTQQ